MKDGLYYTQAEEVLDNKPEAMEEDKESQQEGDRKKKEIETCTQFWMGWLAEAEDKKDSKKMQKVCMYPT